MRTIEVKLYKYDELSDGAKQRAREWYSELEAQDFGAHGELYEQAQTAAKLLGITFRSVPVPLMGGGTRTEPDIRWSGFNSQGDGASFVGSYEYVKSSAKAIAKEFPKDTKLQRIAQELSDLQKKHGYKIEAQINQSGHYSHKYSMNASVTNATTGNEFDDPEIDDTVLGLMRDFAQWIYDDLEAEYYYRLEDEQVEESIRANEYEFTKDGKIA